MLEVSVNQRTEDGKSTRTIGVFRVDETKPKSAPEVLQPLDGRSLVVILKVLRNMKADQDKASKDFA